MCVCVSVYRVQGKDNSQLDSLKNQNRKTLKKLKMITYLERTC